MDYIVPPWVGWFSISIWLGLYLPISLCGICLFYKHRFVTAIAKRHVTMTLIVLSLCLTNICIDRVLWTLHHICNISPNSIFLYMSTILTYPLILYGLIYSLLWRFWIIRYDIQFVRASMNNKWRSIINCEYLAKNWYLINRSKWGNSKFIAVYIILPLYTMSILISIIIRLQIYTYSDYIHLWIVDMIMAIIPYCIIIYLWLNTPAFHDTFWIHNATKLIFIVLFILFVTNVTFGLLCLCLQFEYELLTLIESHIICIVHVSIIIIMTFVVFYKNKVSFTPHLQLQAFVATQNQANQANNPLQLTATNSLPAPHNNPKNHIRHKRISLTQLLEDSIMFHTFMSHLAHEFSMECLLAIVEFTEYTEYCINNFNDYLSSKNDYRSKLIKLPPDIPKSLIVYGSKTVKNHDTFHKRIITPMIQNIFNKTPPPPDNSINITIDKKDPSPSPVPVTVHTMYMTTLHATPESKPIDNIIVTSTVDNINMPTLTLTATNNSSQIPAIPVPIPIHRNSSDSLQVQQSHSNSHSHSQSHNRRKSKGLYGDLKPFQTKAKLLYEKYIEEGAHYEINISGELRKRFNVMLDDDELWNSVFDGNKNRNKLQNEKIISEKLHEILSLLNKSIQEMIKLLSHSYARFKQTDTYDKLLRILK